MSELNEFRGAGGMSQLTDQIVINAMSYCARSSRQIYRLVKEAGHAITPLELHIKLDSLVDRAIAETKWDLFSGEKVWRLLEQGEQHGAPVQFPRKDQSVLGGGSNLSGSQGAQENE